MLVQHVRTLSDVTVCLVESLVRQHIVVLYCIPRGSSTLATNPAAVELPALVAGIVVGFSNSSSGGAHVPTPPMPPPVLDMVPLAQEKRRREQARLHGEDGDAWERFILPDGWGRLVLDPFANSLGAHCGNREHQLCRTNRVLGKRPVGYLVAWLLQCGCPTATDHKDIKLDHQADGPLSHAKRLQAQLRFQSLPGAHRILALGQGEQQCNSL